MLLILWRRDRFLHKTLQGRSEEERQSLPLQQSCLKIAKNIKTPHHCLKTKSGLFFTTEGEGATVERPALSPGSFLNLGLAKPQHGGDLALHLQPPDASLCPIRCP